MHFIYQKFRCFLVGTFLFAFFTASLQEAVSAENQGAKKPDNPALRFTPRSLRKAPPPAPKAQKRKPSASSNSDGEENEPLSAPLPPAAASIVPAIPAAPTPPAVAPQSAARAQKRKPSASPPGSDSSSDGEGKEALSAPHSPKSAAALAAPQLPVAAPKDLKTLLAGKTEKYTIMSQINKIKKEIPLTEALRDNAAMDRSLLGKIVENQTALCYGRPNVMGDHTTIDMQRRVHFTVVDTSGNGSLIFHVTDPLKGVASYWKYDFNTGTLVAYNDSQKARAKNQEIETSYPGTTQVHQPMAQAFGDAMFN